MNDIVYRDRIPCKLVKSGYTATIWDSKDIRPTFTNPGSEPVLINTKALRGPVGGWDGTGQREIRIFRRLLCIPQSEERVFFPTHTGMYTAGYSLEKEAFLDIDIEDMERKAIASKESAQRRAKKMCRQKIKHGGFRHLLTGTYRENMLDFDRIVKDHAAWHRKMRALIPGFRSVWAFEPQKRGAWHFHATCDSLPRFVRYKGKKINSYEASTLIWQAITGDIQFDFVGPLQPGQSWPEYMVTNGTINVDGYTQKTKKKQHADAKAHSLAKMALYVSKYLTKHHAEGLAGRRMWASTSNLTPPKPIVLQFEECSFADLISACFEVPDGHRIARHWLNQFGDCWVLDTEPVPA